VKIIDDATLQRLEELEKGSTQGNWYADEAIEGGGSVVMSSETGRVAYVHRSDENFHDEEDAVFIAASRNALPLLLDSVRRLKEALALYRKWRGKSLSLADSDEVMLEYGTDMARIRELVGE